MSNHPATAAFYPHLTHTVTLHLGNASLSGIETRINTRIIPRQRGFSADAHPHKRPPHEQSGLVEPAITEWVKDLPGEGSWSLTRTWLGAGEALNGDEYKALRSLIASSLVSSVRSEAGFSSVDADRLVRLAETSIKADASASPLSKSLADEGPNTRSAFVRL